MNHWRVLQHPQWFLGEWWRELWQQAPTKRGPLIYLLTAPIFTGLGPGFDRAIYVNLLFTAVLLGATYAIGRRICSPAVGLWAAGLSLLSPVLLRLQKDYLQDFPLTATVTLMVMVMTYFWLSEKSTLRWGMAILWGVTVGLTLLTRTSGLLFVVPPIGWMLGVSLWQRQWLKLGQVILGTAVGVLTLWPWFSTSWLTIISTTLESNAYGVVYADNPQANTLAGWLFYPKALPQMMSWPLFALAAIAWLLILVQLLTQRHRPQAKAGLIKLQSGLWGHRQGILWLLAIIFGVYILFSLGSNKVLRFVIPCLPLLWVVLAQGIVVIQNRGWHYLRWSAVSLAIALSVTQLFFGGDAPRQPPDQLAWPNQAVIKEIVETTPLLKTTLGLAVNTAEINPFNMDFYGAVANFQVFARQLSLDPKTALQDSQALDWYLAKTGDQGAYDTIEAGQQKLLGAIETSRDLSLHKTWPLPDGSTLQLYHRNQPPITVKRIATQDNQPVSLHRVDGSPQVVPGQPYPITYTLRGPGAALQAGLLLLT
ncbi:MAG: glycosyltransferase family 39 protein, partial [Cyanobacteria bacterium P01_D01_bin.2]